MDLISNLIDIKTAVNLRNKRGASAKPDTKSDKVKLEPSLVD